MKALTLTQPWAQLVADGRKRVETRGWRPRDVLRRGDLLAIHAAKTWTAADRDCAEALGYNAKDLTRGAIIAVVRFKGAYRTEALVDEPWLTEEERSYGDYRPRRFGWALELVKKLDPPIAARGALNLWDVDVINQIEAKRPG